MFYVSIPVTRSGLASLAAASEDCIDAALPLPLRLAALAGMTLMPPVVSIWLAGLASAAGI